MNKAFKKLLNVVFCILIAVVFLSGCEGKFTDQGEVATYYAFEDSKTISLNLNERKFALETGSSSLAGKYSFDGTTLTLTFDGEKTPVSVDYQTNVLTFQYQGTQYTLYRDVNYTVSYNTNGGTAIAAATVQNGKKAVKPASNPTKDGNRFLGWYLDSGYKTAYDFDQIVTADTTIYARFETETDLTKEFDVAFVTGVEGVLFDDEKTFNGTLYNLPVVKVADKKFLGWWVSDYEDPTKLTYEFKESMILKQSTTLYAVYEEQAPVVSVSNNKVTWNSLGVNKQYAINIVNADDLTSDEVFTKRVSQTSVDFDFSSVDAGNYLVSVTCGDYTGKAYYCNNGLSRVSNFQVVNNKLTWNKVENATNYAITIECGLSGHNHKDLALGDVNEYDLSNCVMPKDGIKVWVKASANGSVASTSKCYEYFNALDSAKNIQVDAVKQEATWDAVAGATSYKVVILADGKENTYTIEDTKMDLSSFVGNLKISVTPIANCMYADAADIDYVKTSLQAPTNIKFLGFNVTWDAVVGAKSYVVKIGDKEFTATSNVLTLTQEQCEAISEFRISIQAKAEDEANNSLFSKETVVNKEGVNEINFKNGVISWSAVPGTLKYAVKIDDAEPVIVENATEYACKITSGNHTIGVTVADAAGKYGDFFNASVLVYALNFDACGGIEIEPYYFVKGDNIGELPVTTFEGYSFIDWYVVPEGAQTSQPKFDKKVFDFDEDVTIFASWQGNTYKVNFDYATYGIEDAKSQNVIYGDSFTLPKVESNSIFKAFIGWYSELNAQGEQYTNANGDSIRAWRDYQDVTLYAAFADVFTFNLINNNTAYSVSKGDGISYVTEITIPTEYNGLPVTTVESSGFQSCSTLVRVRIPNTIVNVETGKSGPNGTGSCFQSCSSLVAVDVYEVEGAVEEDIKYLSIDGVLIYKNEFNGVEIAYVPYATKGGTYTIPSVVTTIPANAFKSCTKLEEIIVPATVEKIDDNAFASCSKVTRITFLEAENPAEEKELVLGANVFQSNSALVTITLPSRLSAFNANIFASCSALEEIKFEGSFSSVKYVAVDGVVFTADMTELLFFPRAKAGAYTIPVGVQKIADSACESCKAITELTISGQVTNIGKNAFKSCTGITKLTFSGVSGDADLTVDESAFYGCNVITELVLPANLVNLKKNAFGNTSKLVKVEVKSVSPSINFEPAAFGTTVTGSNTPTYYVTDLTIAKEVAVFDVTAVFGAIKLVNVTVEKGNNNFASIDGVLYDKDVTRVVYYPTEKEGAYTLPETITSIGARVFQSKTGITSITINKNVIEIGESAFQSCTKLTEVIFEDGGTNELVIGKLAFTGCSILEKAQLPNRVVEIPEGCFKQCRALDNFVIPNSVKRIGSEAFYYCDALTTLTIPASVTEIVAATSTTTDDKEARVRAFDFCRGLVEYKVENGNKNYQAIDGILYENVFDVEGNIESVILIASPLAKTGTATLPTNVSKIQNRAFYYSNGLETLKFAGDLSCDCTIGSFAFYYCQTLKHVLFAKGVTEIGLKAFYSCTLLEDVTFPNTLTLLGENAFYICPEIKTVTFEEGGTAPLKIAKGSTYTVTSGSTAGDTSYYNAFYKADAIEEIILPERTVEIGQYSFAGMKGLKRVVLPSTLKTVGTYAFTHDENLESITFSGSGIELATLPSNVFSYTKIKSIDIPEGVTKLDSSCLSYCYELESVVIPASVKEIGTYVFSQDKKLDSVTFAKGSQLTKIGNYSFTTTGIKSIVIPQSVTEIGQYAFNKCNQLASITFDGTDTEEGVALKTIGQYAFSFTAIEKFEFPYCGKDSKGVYNKLTIGTSTIKKLFQGCVNLNEIHLSQAVVDVADLFSGCPVSKITVPQDHENFQVATDNPFILNKTGTAIVFAYGRLVGTVTIPEGFTEIGENCFKNQGEVEKIMIPKTVKTIGKNAFLNCHKLKEVIFAQNCLLDSIGDTAFQNCISLEKIDLPDEITTLPKGLFSACQSLTTVDLPAKLTTILTYVFTYCKSLKDIVFPSTLQSIGQYAFEYCESLTNITIPSSLKDGTAGWDHTSFAYCTGLTKVTISDGIKNVPNNAFRGCTSLSDVYIGNAVQSIGNYAFDGAIFKTITVPATVQYLASSKSATGTGYIFSNNPNLEEIIFEKNSQCTIFGTYAFKNCPNLTKINLPENLESIANGAFLDTGLTSITLPSSLKTIGATTTTADTGVFQGTKLSSITLPDNLTTIGAYAFYQIKELKEITIPSKVTTIGLKAFSETGLTKVKIADAVVGTWGNNAFSDNPELKEIDLGTKLSKLGVYMFANCPKIEEVVLPSSLTVPNSSATNYTTVQGYFQNCTGLKKVTINGKITTLGPSMFEGCTSLESITLPTTVKTFGNAAFKDCTSLKEITIPSACTNLGNSLTTGSLFEGCTSLSKVTFASDTACTYVAAYTFKGCTSLKQLTLPTSVKSIGIGFLSGSGVDSFEIGKNVATISGLFNESPNLKNITVNKNNTKFSIYNNCAIVDTTGKVYSVFNISENQNFVVPTGATFNSNAFIGVSLGTLTLPDSLEKIPSSAFVGLTAKKVILGSKVTEIGGSAFKTTNIDVFDFGPNPKTVKYSAFESSVVNEFLNTESVNTIEYKAFANCTGFTEFILNSEITKLGYGSFMGTNLKEIVIPDSVVELTTTSTADNGTFSYCEDLKKVTISENLEIMGAYAFSHSGLVEVVVPGNITTWNNYVFANCPNLEKVELKSGTGIESTKGSYMFSNCTSLKEVILPNNLVSTTSNMFAGCSSLQKINLPNGLEILQTNTFKDCDLLEVTLPNSVINVFAGVFENNVNLTKVKLSENQVCLGAIPSSYGASSTSGDGVFAGCTSLKEIEIPTSCVTIAQNTFAYCTSLKSLYIPEEVLYIGNECFLGWTKDQVVSLQCYYYDTVGQFYHSEGVAANAGWDYSCEATFVYGVKPAK